MVQHSQDATTASEKSPSPLTSSNTWTLSNANNPFNRLISTVAQYPIFEPSVFHLRPADLERLAQTCQSIHDTLKLSQATSKTNLLTKTLCLGIGLRVRKGVHDRLSPPTTLPTSVYAAADSDPHIESRPCITCGINTCDECHIHVVYQSLLGAHHFDGQSWWAGHVFEYAGIVRILPSPPPSSSAAWHTDPSVESASDSSRQHGSTRTPRSHPRHGI